MKRALQVTSVASMIDQFILPNISLLQSMGYRVEVAANFNEGNTTSNARLIELKKNLEDTQIKVNNIEFQRNIFSLRNISSFFSMNRLFNSKKFDLVHCHSPIGGLTARLAILGTKSKHAKVIYTAHGYHFYKGAPIFNWALYFPVEWFLSFFTDVLITINSEDYNFSKKYMNAKKVVYIPGVGIDITNDLIKPQYTIREELGLPDDAFLFFSVGELNSNKNHKVFIHSLKEISKEFSNTYYIICGQGPLDSELIELVDNLNLRDKVFFLGYRTDIRYLLREMNVFVFPSYREGLSVALMEAMEAGIPVICSKIRGNIDLIDDAKGGYLVDDNSFESYYDKARLILNSSNLTEMGKYNLEKIKLFSLSNVLSIMEIIYGAE